MSIIAQNADFDLFKHFGFQTGRSVNKFANYNNCERAENGIFYIKKGINAYVSAVVKQTVDLGTHTMFIAELTDMEVLSTYASATYDYYLKNIKSRPQEVGKNEKGQTIWRCTICGYEYAGEELPDDFICPVCKHSAFYFEKVK